MESTPENAEQERLYSLLAHGVIAVNRDGIITLANIAAEQSFGYGRGELIDQPVSSLVPDVSRGHHHDMVEGFMSQAPPQHRRIRARPQLCGQRKDGSTFPILIELSPAEDGQSVLATIIDISAQSEAEERAQQNKERLLYAQSVGKMGFWDWHVDNDDVFFSEQLCSMLGLDLEPGGYGLGEFLALVNAEGRGDAEAAIRGTVATGQACDVDVAVTRASGKIRYLRLQGELGQVGTDPSLRVSGTIADISERKLLEQQLVRAQRMEAFGRLASGIAHDFNNLLTVIGSCAALLETDAADRPPEEAREDVQLIQIATSRAAQLTKQLLAFTRRSVLERRVLSLNTVILDLDKMLRRLLSEDIELVTLPKEDLPLCFADASQLEQVLLNLALNARDAMPEGGTLTITTEACTVHKNASDGEAGEKTCGPKADEKKPGEYVSLRVRDDGTGMSEAIRERIFDPFFTTKKSDRGTGLGLATCVGIVSQLGGTIEVTSTLGEGTEFHIAFPVENVAASEDARIVPTTSEGGTETILLVEDEATVRNVLVRVLRSKGYEVIPSENGEEALAAVERYGKPIDLLIADCVMPRMGGRRLSDLFSKRYPHTAVLLMSGYAQDPTSDGSTPDAPILAKPFMAEALLSRVRALLDRKRGCSA